EQLSIGPLLRRVEAGDVKEVILALGATVDGQTTGHYLADRLHDFDVAISRLAHGVPVGGELDYLDDGTLIQALKARQTLSVHERPHPHAGHPAPPPAPPPPRLYPEESGARLLGALPLSPAPAHRLLLLAGDRDDAPQRRTFDGRPCADRPVRQRARAA